MADCALSGVTILDLSQFISGPYCTKLLAGYGAGVIKIEPPGHGDPARHEGPFYQDLPNREGSGLFLHLNTNKKSITLNLQTSTGAKIFKKLVEKADIVVENFPPGVMDELGISYEVLSEINPALIMTSITPFGQSGPYRNYKATNLTEFALGGQMAMMGEPDREPVKAGGSQAEYQGGLNGFAATATALYGALMSGEGEHIDISIMECIAAVCEASLPAAAYLGRSGPRRGNLASAIFGIYPCKDGHVGMWGMPRNWPGIPQTMGMPELIVDPRFENGPQRLQNNDELQSIIASWAIEHSKEDIYLAAGQNRGPFGYVATTEELLQSPQLTARAHFAEIDHPVVGQQTYPGAPAKMSETPWQAGPAPLLGQHNEEIFLGQLGLSRQDLARLRRAGVI